MGRMLRCAVVSAIGLLFAVLSVYASGSAEKATTPATVAGKSGSVTMWDFPLTANDQKLFEPLIRSFTEKYPKISVNVQVIPWNGRYEKMLAAIAGGDPPNVVYLNSFQIPLFASTGNLVNMSATMPASDLASYNPGALKALTYNGKVYAVPILTENLGYFYNVDLFRKAGLDPNNPPQTWRELEHALKVLTVKDAQGNTVQWGGEFDLNRPSPITSILPFVWQAGGEPLDSSGNVVIDSPAAVRALTFIKGLFDKGYIQKSDISGGGLHFASGKIGIDLQMEPFDVAKVAKENPNLNFKVGPILRDNKKIGYVTVGAYGIFSKASDRGAAVQWLTYLTNKANTLYILKNTGFMSPRTDLKPAEYLTDPRLVFMASQAKWATGTGPISTHYAQILNVLGSSFNSIILGIKSPQQGLDEAAAQIKSIVK